MPALSRASSSVLYVISFLVFVFTFSFFCFSLYFLFFSFFLCFLFFSEENRCYNCDRKRNPRILLVILRWTVTYAHDETTAIISKARTIKNQWSPSRNDITVHRRTGSNSSDRNSFIVSDSSSDTLVTIATAADVCGLVYVYMYVYTHVCICVCVCIY